MTAKKFKFISPGVFLNEIDNSQLPREPAAEGPIIIGRTVSGPGMRPVTVDSFEEFVSIFSEPHPGGDAADPWRYGNFSAPTYASYAAQAWLKNSPTCTVVRLMGKEHANKTTGVAGWKTSNIISDISYTAYTTASAFGGEFVNTASFIPESYGTITLIDALGEKLIFDMSGTAPNSLNGVFTSGSTHTPLVTVALKTGSHSASGARHMAQQLVTAINSQSFGISASLDSPYASNHGGYKLFQTVKGTVGNTTISTGTRPGGAPPSPKAMTFTSTTASFASAFSGGTDEAASAGGAFGLFLFPNALSASAGETTITATGSLAAVWYGDTAHVGLSGTGLDGTTETGVLGKFVGSDSSGNFKLAIMNGGSATKTIKFNLTEASANYARKVFNVDPTKVDSNTTPTDDLELYWLGETYENDFASNLQATGGQADGTHNTDASYMGIVMALSTDNAHTTAYEHADRRVAKQDPRTGWVITRDTGETSSYAPTTKKKLFRFIALDHGEWAHRNLKVSVTNIRESTLSSDPYAKFDVLVRDIKDKDKSITLMERFNNCNLNPDSDNFIGRKIGDSYLEFDSTKRRLVEKGDYPNKSKFIRVDINPTVISAPDSNDLPFGYYGPIKYKDAIYEKASIDKSLSSEPVAANASIIQGRSSVTDSNENKIVLPASQIASASLMFKFPHQRLRLSSSQDGLSNNGQAFWGAWFGKSDTSTTFNESVFDFARPLAKGTEVDAATSNITEFSYIFSLDDIIYTPASGSYTYLSGSRASGQSVTALSGSSYLLKPTTAGESPVNSFTMPLVGGTDGTNIKHKDPFGTNALGSGDELTNYAYNSVKEVIDSIKDPEFVLYNIATMPAITAKGLTSHLLETIEARSDALAIIDLDDNGFTAAHEGSLGNVKPTVASQPRTVVSTLEDRSINSSYGCAYYPWVQIRDTLKGSSVYVPPSIPALGAMSYTDRVKAPWFAPAGFNRGGLSSGVAGLPVIAVTHKLTSGDRDDLYDANINPIASFPNEGIVIFGQKTLQQTRSALDRINVRRLLLHVKRGISAISNDLLFEPNVQETWDRFIGRAEPFLQDVQARFGLTAYKLILDETTTTPDLIDQNILYAKVFLQPARAIEFIAVDFVITNTGASFED
tara:strand:+ start:6842 stop:10234 length:3393 start_codon:yes stop_codon:yes gene_type:complete